MINLCDGKGVGTLNREGGATPSERERRVIPDGGTGGKRAWGSGNLDHLLL